MSTREGTVTEVTPPDEVQLTKKYDLTIMPDGPERVPILIQGQMAVKAVLEQGIATGDCVRFHLGLMRPGVIRVTGVDRKPTSPELEFQSEGSHVRWGAKEMM
ncbi:hypothetical protein MMC28_011196 [Mycoblastus sanguinarius]|nr:hypothetical protein [Mycoblastus sanguinarius]